MLKKIGYQRPFLILVDDDDGALITRYINVNQIIDIEVNNLTLSILVLDDIEYSYELDKIADVNAVLNACVVCLNNDHNCNNDILKSKFF